MQRLITSIAIFTAACVLSVAHATPPSNLALAKKTVIEYHDSGAYAKDCASVADQALDYLRSAHFTKTDQGKPAIVFDIDETSLSMYSSMKHLNFGGTMEQFHAADQKGDYVAIPSTLKLYQYAIANNIAVIFITGRPKNEEAATIRNLKAEGYNTWNKIVFRDGAYKKTSAAIYKTAMRKQLTANGYHIVANIGDQTSDLAGGYADKIFLLPNPYYLIN